MPHSRKPAKNVRIRRYRCLYGPVLTANNQVANRKSTHHGRQSLRKLRDIDTLAEPGLEWQNTNADQNAGRRANSLN